MDPTPRVTCRPATHMLSAGTPARAFVCGYPYASPAPSSLIQYSHRGYPYALCRHPHPARAFGAPPPPPPRGRGQCVAISGEQLYPGCSRWEAVPGSFPGSPHALDRGDIATGGGADGEGELVPPPLSLTLPNSAHLTDPPRRHFYGDARTLSAGTPTPPAPSALLPRPLPGAWAVLAISGEQPYPALFQDLPMHWTVGISPRGVGPTGRGNSFPLPCL